MKRSLGRTVGKIYTDVLVLFKYHLQLHMHPSSSWNVPQISQDFIMMLSEGATSAFPLYTSPTCPTTPTLPLGSKTSQSYMAVSKPRKISECIARFQHLSRYHIHCLTLPQSDSMEHSCRSAHLGERCALVTKLIIETLWDNYHVFMDQCMTRMLEEYTCTYAVVQVS